MDEKNFTCVRYVFGVSFFMQFLCRPKLQSPTSKNSKLWKKPFDTYPGTATRRHWKLWTIWNVKWNMAKESQVN